jgi:hypothetical protein
MDDQFRFVTNYKLGAEFRKGIFRLRGGFAFYDDPRKSSTVDSSITYINFGGGIRLPKFYVDLGIITSKHDSSVSPFASSMYNTVENKRISALITAGFNF